MRSAVVALTLLLLSVPAHSTKPVVRFHLFAGGEVVGVEDVQTDALQGKVEVTSVRRIDEGKGSRTLSMRLIAGLGEGPVEAFQARGVRDRVKETVSLRLVHGKLTGALEIGGGTKRLSVASPPDAVTLADPFVAPYFLLAERCRKLCGVDPAAAPGNSTRFSVVYPLSGSTGRVTVTNRGRETIRINGVSMETTRLLAVPDRGEVSDLWLDRRGRLVAVAWPVAARYAVWGKSLEMDPDIGADPPLPKGLWQHRVRIASGNSVLSATIMGPAHAKERMPAALLVSGSGPQDRNDNTPGTLRRWDLLYDVAVAFAKRGVATLRYDERGVGHSSGTFETAGLYDLLADARNALSFLAGRGDVDPSRLAVVGHSEGALLAAFLGGEQGPPVKAVVLIGPPARPLDQILTSQIRDRLHRRGETKAQIARAIGNLRAFFEQIRLSKGDFVDFDGEKRPARWLRQHMELDPMDVYGTVHIPCLVLGGRLDLQVPPASIARVAAAIPGKTRLELFPGLDHFLMPGARGLAAYGDTRRTIDRQALKALTSWTATTLR